MNISLPARFDEAWSNLAPRERNLIAIGLFVLLPVGLYLYLWQPLAVERVRLDARVTQLRGQLAQLRTDSEEVLRLRGQAPIRSASTLEATARLAASRFQLDDKLAEVTPQGGDRLIINMEDVDFDAWLRWIGELGVQGVVVSACEVEALPGQERVHAKATLMRGAS